MISQLQKRIEELNSVISDKAELEKDTTSTKKQLVENLRKDIARKDAQVKRLHDDNKKLFKLVNELKVKLIQQTSKGKKREESGGTDRRNSGKDFHAD